MKACIPFILIFVFLLLTSSMVPPVHDALGKVKTAVQIYSGKGGTPYTFTWIATPGVLILLAAVIGGKIQGADFSLMGKVLKDTCRQMWKTVVTIMSIMAMAKIMSHSGMITEIAGMMVALTGSFYPAAAPFVGAIGTFVTGSGTSANVLFGGLQVETGRKSWTGSILACRSEYGWGYDRKDDLAAEYRDWNGSNGKCRK